MSRARARLSDVPEAIASREEVGAAHRVITYRLPAENPGLSSAEDWARATFEGAPAAVRLFLTLGWRLVLGLRPARGPAAEALLGWSIAEHQPQIITLRSGSRLITGHNIATLQDGSVFWTTLVRYENALARPVWRLTELVHRIVLPYIFTRAGRGVSGRAGSGR